MKSNHHIKAIRRLIRSDLAGYRNATEDDGDMSDAVQHYRRLLREDAARIRRAQKAQQLAPAPQPAGPTAHNPAA